MLDEGLELLYHLHYPLSNFHFIAFVINLAQALSVISIILSIAILGWRMPWVGWSCLGLNWNTAVMTWSNAFFCCFLLNVMVG